jgi:hypothetical protein
LCLVVPGLPTKGGGTGLDTCWLGRILATDYALSVSIFEPRSWGPTWGRTSIPVIVMTQAHKSMWLQIYESRGRLLLFTLSPGCSPVPGCSNLPAQQENNNTRGWSVSIPASHNVRHVPPPEPRRVPPFSRCKWTSTCPRGGEGGRTGPTSGPPGGPPGGRHRLGLS